MVWVQRLVVFVCFFFFNDTATTEIYTLSLHDALPILRRPRDARHHRRQHRDRQPRLDRKSTRLNSSHTIISYAVFCLKKKKKKNENASATLLTSPDLALFTLPLFFSAASYFFFFF